MNIAARKLNYLAAFLDMSTNYYEPTARQVVAGNLILRAAEETKDKNKKKKNKEEDKKRKIKESAIRLAADRFAIAFVHSSLS